ncbi:MAG: hypothetical protein Q9O74_11385 [Planctomycetota bacterium]|nr:hypothetical protein [Planctomycetota bacterium]
MIDGFVRGDAGAGRACRRRDGLVLALAALGVGLPVSVLVLPVSVVALPVSALASLDSVVEAADAVVEAADATTETAFQSLFLEVRSLKLVL